MTLVFGKNKSLLAASLSSQRICMYVGVRVGNDKRSRELILSNSWGPGLFVARGLWGIVISFHLPQHLKTKLFKYFPTFPWFLLNTFLVLNNLFSMMCKMRLKTPLLQSLALRVISWEQASLIYFLLCLICWLLLCSVHRAVPGTELVSDFFSQGHQFCPPMNKWHDSITWWKEP